MGWSMVRRSYPMAANRLIEAVCQRRAKSHRTAAASRKQAKALQSLEQSIAALISKLEALPEDLAEDTRWGGAIDESKRYDGPPDRLAKAVDALHELSPGLTETLSRLNLLGTRTHEGHLPNKPSYDIAQALFGPVTV